MVVVIETDRRVITPEYTMLSLGMMRNRFLDKEAGIGKILECGIPTFENQVFCARRVCKTNGMYYRCVIRGRRIRNAICIACTFIGVKQAFDCTLIACESRTPVSLDCVFKFPWEFRLCNISLDDFNHVRIPYGFRPPQNPSIGFMLKYIKCLIEVHNAMTQDGIRTYIESDAVNDFIHSHGGEKTTLIGFRDTTGILLEWIDFAEKSGVLISISTLIDEDWD